VQQSRNPFCATTSKSFLHNKQEIFFVQLAKILLCNNRGILFEQQSRNRVCATIKKSCLCNNQEIICMKKTQNPFCAAWKLCNIGQTSMAHQVPYGTHTYIHKEARRNVWSFMSTHVYFPTSKSFLANLTKHLLHCSSELASSPRPSG
jgi:hypothetical protein